MLERLLLEWGESAHPHLQGQTQIKMGLMIDNIDFDEPWYEHNNFINLIPITAYILRTANNGSVSGLIATGLGAMFEMD